MSEARPYAIAFASRAECIFAMVKASKFFLKQAAKAERAAAAPGERASEQLVNLAAAFRAQAEVLKHKKSKKKPKG